METLSVRYLIGRLGLNKVAACACLICCALLQLQGSNLDRFRRLQPCIGGRLSAQNHCNPYRCRDEIHHTSWSFKAHRFFETASRRYHGADLSSPSWGFTWVAIEILKSGFYFGFALLKKNLDLVYTGSR